MARTEDGKWKVPASKLVFSFFEKTDVWVGSAEVSLKTKLGQRTTNGALNQLLKEGEIQRTKCPCGMGYIYKRTW